MWKSLLIFLSFFCFTHCIQAQEVKGTVTDALLAPLPGVIVSLNGKPTTTTNLDGNFQITIGNEVNKISFSFLSFATFDTTIIGNRVAEKLNIILQSSIKELDVVVVSAGRYEQKLEEVTVSMEVLRPRLIENTNAVTIENTLDQVPGVLITDGQANIRGGAGWSYGAGSRVQVLVDDLPILAADASDAKWSSMPIENLEQVEIIKGASSALFGSSALNGVINLRTAYPKTTPQTKVIFYGASYDKPDETEMRWWGNINPKMSGLNFFHSRMAGNLDLVIGGSTMIDESYRQGENESRARFNVNTRWRNQKIKGLNYGVNINSQISEGSLFFLWANDSIGALRPAGGTSSATTTLSDYTTFRTNVDPFVNYSIDKNHTVRLRSRFFRSNNTNNTNQNSIADTYYAELQYQQKIGEHINFTGGLVNINYSVKSELYNNHKASNKALFAQIDFKFNRLNAVIGGRAEQSALDSIIDDITPVFRAGINYRMGQATYLRASVGQGYRFPSIAEKFVQTNVGNLFVFPSDSLLPEKGISYEVGLKQGFKIGSWMGLADLAYFINTYENMMEFSFAQWGGLVPPLFGFGFKSVNVGDIKITGAEISLSATGKIGKINATLLAGYMYMNPRQTRYDSLYVKKLGPQLYLGSDSSNFLKYRYSHLIKTDLELGYKKFSGGISIRYNSFMKNIDKIFVQPGLSDLIAPGIKKFRDRYPNGDLIFDLRSSIQLNSTTKVSLICKNVLNRTYMSRPADIQPPRTWFIQILVTI